jgi:hypothetical protein
MIDPRERYGDPEEVTRMALASYASELWTALPGEIVSVNFEQMTVVVQPTILVKVMQPDGTQVDTRLPQLVDVPIVYMCGGGVALTTPIAQGDECLCVFSSRCIDGWWQLGGAQTQTDQRLHDLSDGFALVGPRSLAKLIPNISQTTGQFRSLDGSTFYEINPTTKQVNVVAPGGFNVTGPSTFNGTVNTIGNITSTGTVMNNNTDIGSTHKHPVANVQTGSSDVETGAPNQ